MLMKIFGISLVVVFIQAFGFEVESEHPWISLFVKLSLFASAIMLLNAMFDVVI